MANTYTLIQAQTLASSAASVSFLSIPATYTDLMLRYSVRADNASTVTGMRISINNDSSALYSSEQIYGSGAAVTAENYARAVYTYAYAGYINGATTTASTFTNGEAYIPNYRVSANKAWSIFNAQENNATAAYLWNAAQLYGSTTAISRLDFALNASVNFVTGSSFYLYGIKNS